VIGLADITPCVIGQSVWLAFGLSLVLILLVAKEACSIRLRARCGERCGVVAVTKSACILQFQQAPT
jgi:hypothetical protein